MIFVTVGNSSWDFSRLVKYMDEVARTTSEEIIIQTGSSSYKPSFATCFDFATKDMINDLHEKARIIISHAGIGSILTAIDMKKPVVLVPRRKELNEMVDDHQIEIASALEAEIGVNIAWEVSDILKFIKTDNSSVSYESERDLLSGAIHRHLASL
jgi:beta-1,4-N-acetylglucosaminyltransferase